VPNDADNRPTGFKSESGAGEEWEFKSTSGMDDETENARSSGPGAPHSPQGIMMDEHGRPISHGIMMDEHGQPISHGIMVSDGQPVSYGLQGGDTGSTLPSTLLRGDSQPVITPDNDLHEAAYGVADQDGDTDGADLLA
jgi:hypothetical protein